MDTTERVLLIFLSSALGLALLLSIILLFILIRIFLHIKHLTEKANEIASKAENVAAFFEKSAPPVVLMRLVSNISEVFKRKDGGRNRKEK